MEKTKKCLTKDEYIDKKTKELAFTWRHASIIESSDNQVKLHFTDWHSRWDAWYEINGDKIMSINEYNAKS